MVFVDVAFPDRIAMGAQSDAEWSTALTAVVGGQESTNENWEDALHRFDASLSVRTATTYALARTHFHEVRGRARKFPFKDFLDFRVTTAQGKLLDATGVEPAANGTYRLHKRYGSTNPWDRRITRPDTPIQVFRTRAAVTTDITGAGAAVTYAGGTVVISGHVAGDTYTWSGTFKVPCRYDIDRLPAAAINKQPAPGGDLLVDCGPIPICEVREPEFE